MDYAAPTGLDPKEKLLPEFFRAGGYSTHMVGKWHLGFCKDEYKSRNRGFDTSFGNYGGQIKYYEHTVTQDKLRVKNDYYKGLPQ